MTFEPRQVPASLLDVRMVYLAVIGRCFLPCVHCHIWKHNTPTLPTETWLQIIDKLGAFCPGASVQFVGGEPLLRRDLEVLIRRAADAGLICGICTNGWMVTPARARSLAEAGVRFGYVSMDGFRAQTVDRTRGRVGSFEKALRAADLLAQQPTIRVVVSAILHAQNADEFAALIDYARTRGFLFMMQTLNETLGAEESVPPWAEKSDLWPRTPAQQDAIARAIDLVSAARADAVTLNTPEQLEAARSYYRNPEEPLPMPCPAGHTEFGIDPLGKVRLCFYKEEIGSATNDTSLSDLFANPATSARRAEIASCKGGCRMNTCNQDRIALLSRR